MAPVLLGGIYSVAQMQRSGIRESGPGSCTTSRILNRFFRDHRDVQAVAAWSRIPLRFIRATLPWQA
jgi:hypothetical protein